MAEDLETLLHRFGEERAFEALGDLMPDAAVFVVDANRTVVHWSSGAEALLGFSAEDALGRLCLESIRCRQCTLGCGVARHGKIDDVPQELYRQDERWLPVRKFARGFFNEAGAFQGAIEVLVKAGEARAEEFAIDQPAGDAVDAEELHGLLSRDAAMQQIFQTIRNVAETDATVLVRGESGSGKELVARAVHLESHRSAGAFVAVNCAALTPSLIESELFGHVRGAFTGAVRDRVGLFEQADGGTLFLDEVAELPLDVQGKLLRVLEERKVTRVGGRGDIDIDVRIVAATHRRLRRQVEEGRFREDLMYRLRVVPLFLPPLRDRGADIEPLLRHFLARFNEVGPRRVDRIAPEAMRALLHHSWPGNVRELRNVVEYAFAVGRGGELRLGDIPPEVRDASELDESPTHQAPVRSVVAPGGEVDERESIREALVLSKGKIGQAARRLGMSRSTFWRKRRSYDL